MSTTNAKHLVVGESTHAEVRAISDGYGMITARVVDALVARWISSTAQERATAIERAAQERKEQSV